jgi:Protein of unknown function (DUF1501)
METRVCLPVLTRRQFFQVGAVGVSGFFLQSMVQPFNVVASRKVSPRGTAEFCIFINLSGGAPHVDTFDIKEGSWTPSDFDIRTITPGVRMPYGLFPQLSGKLNQLALVRSLQAWENEHIRGQYYLQVAHQTSPARNKEMPSLGAVIAYECGQHQRGKAFLPPYVAMNFTSGPFRVIGEGCLDSKYSPLTLEISDKGFDFVVSEAERTRFQRRWDFLQKLSSSQSPNRLENDRFFQNFDAFYRGAHAMMESPEIARILKVQEEERQRYGGSRLGEACVLARNLVKADAGTRFIMISHFSWDLHQKIYAQEGHYKLCRELDLALAGLLSDLETTRTQDGRTLLEKTFVCCLGEFGRTPGPLTVNQGRDHHKDAFCGVFAGGGTRGGRVIGATDDLGSRVVDPGWHKKRPIYIEDVAATIYSVMGIDWTKKIVDTPSGRAFEYIENQSGTDFIDPGEISEIFA